MQDADLRLRPVVLPDDVALAVPWYGDAEVMRLSEFTTEPYDAETVRRMYAWFLERGEAWIVELRTDAGTWEPIGDIALTPDTVPIVIGRPEHRGRGYGRRALRLVVDHARRLGWQRLRTKGIRVGNDRSRRAFEAAGFRLVRTGPNEAGHDTWFHELAL